MWGLSTETMIDGLDYVDVIALVRAHNLLKIMMKKVNMMVHICCLMSSRKG